MSYTYVLYTHVIYAGRPAGQQASKQASMPAGGRQQASRQQASKQAAGSRQQAGRHHTANPPPAGTANSAAAFARTARRPENASCAKAPHSAYIGGGSIRAENAEVQSHTHTPRYGHLH